MQPFNERPRGSNNSLCLVIGFAVLSAMAAMAPRTAVAQEAPTLTVTVVDPTGAVIVGGIVAASGRSFNSQFWE